MKSFFLGILVSLLLANCISAFDRDRDCKCRILPTSRIIGGKLAHHTAHPWQVVVALRDMIPVPDILRKLVPEAIKLSKLVCGASVINERWILSAGHCAATGLPITDIRIGYGSNDLVEMYNKNQYIEIEEVFVHPLYESTQSGVINDVALFKLKTPLPRFSKTLQPACLPSSSEKVDKYEGLLKISGFGSTVDVTFDLEKGTQTPTKVSRWLKEADLYDNSDILEVCKRSSSDGKVSDQNICINNEESNDTACKGDSGGPLVQIKNGRATVIGVASFVSHTVKDQKITVCTGDTAYTRLSTMMPFITSHVDDDYCI